MPERTNITISGPERIKQFKWTARALDLSNTSAAEKAIDLFNAKHEVKAKKQAKQFIGD